MNYKEALNVLESASSLGSRPGLENITRLCTLLGNSQDQLNIVHVAGTNGKGSTCKMLARISKEAGYKTGLFVSPFFGDYCDSFLINGKIISQKSFGEMMGLVHKQALQIQAEGQNPTEFELLTACAFLWFLREQCDVVVLETGMGGRLDSTNVIKRPLASVIGAISLDHTAFLGDTPEKIAFEKCGIIKQNALVVSYPDQPDVVFEIIKKTAADRNCLFFVPHANQIEILSANLSGTKFKYKGNSFHIVMPGAHQVLNAATAIETVQALNKHTDLKFPINAVKKGLAAARLPARQEMICQNPAILLDGAHNLQGIQALHHTIEKNFPNKRMIVVMGMLKDKQYGQSIEIVAKRAAKFIAALPDSPRALDTQTMAGIAKKYCGDVLALDDPKEALEEAIASCGDRDAIVICGSLYLANKVRAFLKDKNFIVKYKDL